MGNACKLSFRVRGGKSQLGELDVDGRTILENILGKYCPEVWVYPSGSVKEPVAGSCERGNEPWSSIEGGELLNNLGLLIASAGTKTCSKEFVNLIWWYDFRKQVWEQWRWNISLFQNILSTRIAGDRCLSVRTSQFSSVDIWIRLTSFLGVTNSKRILYRTSLLVSSSNFKHLII
jgi:hypothetical protein